MRLNHGHDYHAILGAEADGRRLVDWLASRYAHSSAAEWSERIGAGLVLLDDRPAGTEALLRRGMRLVWRRPAWAEPEAPTTFAVLFEDEDLLAVAKPAGLPTLPGGGFLENTLLHRVRVRDPRSAPLHRLGRHTSGIVLFARNASAHTELSRQWSERSVFKRYRALAGGMPETDSFPICVSIGPLPHPLLGSIFAAVATGKSARSDVVVLERRPGSFLCDVMLPTGRPHQIRIHLAAAGHPLVGDPLYGIGGLPLPDSRALPGDPGYLLHAAELRVAHPRTGLPVTIVCKPPNIALEFWRSTEGTTACR